MSILVVSLYQCKLMVPCVYPISFVGQARAVFYLFIIQEGSSSTSGSTISEGESSSEYGDTPEINDESRPPANEIVTGIAYNNMFYQVSVHYIESLHTLVL